MKTLVTGCSGMVGSGNQYVSWISLGDVVGAIDFLIRHDTTQGAGQRGHSHTGDQSPIDHRSGQGPWQANFFQSASLYGKDYFRSNGRRDGPEQYPGYPTGTACGRVHLSRHLSECGAPEVC
jgi:hypothetical protein